MKYLKQIWSAASDASSKRFNGTYGFAIFNILIIFIVLYDYLQDNKLEEITASLLQTLGYLSAVLLGVAGVIEGFKNKLSK